MYIIFLSFWIDCWCSYHCVGYTLKETITTKLGFKVKTFLLRMFWKFFSWIHSEHLWWVRVLFFFWIVHSCNMMLYKYSQICGKVTKPLRLKSLHFVVLQGVISDSSSFHIRLTLRHLTRLKVCLKQRMKERRGKLVCSDSTIYSLPDWIFFFFWNSSLFICDNWLVVHTF